MIYFEHNQPHYFVWPALAVGIEKELWIGIGWLDFEFGWRKTLTAQRVNHAEHIPKFIVEKWPHHTRRQAAAHVTDLFAHGVPNLRNSPGVRVVFDLKNDLRLAGLGITSYLVGKGHLLEGALDFVGHLLGHLLSRGAGPIGPHHHGAEGEGWVFVLPQLKIRRHAQHHQHHHQVAGQGGVLQRPAREVETGVVGAAHGITVQGQPAQRAPCLALRCKP